MKKQFVSNIVLLFIINLLVKPFYVFYVETDAQNILGTQTFGTYFYHLNFVFLFQFMGDFGLQTWNHQHISKNREKVSVILPTVMAAKIVLSFIWMVCVLSLSWYFPVLESDILVPVTINVMLGTLFILIRSFISGMGFFTTDSWLSALDKLMMIVVLSWFMYFRASNDVFTLDDFIYGQMFSLVVANLIAMILLVNYIPNLKEFRFLNYFRWQLIKETLHKCAPYAVILFLMMSYNKLDGFLLGYLKNDNGMQAGIYAASYRIYDAANMFLYLVPALVLPMFSNMIGTGQAIKGFADMVVRWLIVITGPVCVISVYFAEDIIRLLYMEHIDEKIISFQILMVSFIMVSFGYLFGALSLAGEKVNKLIPVFFSGLVINFFLNIFLIPEFGAKGAAITTAATQFWVLTGQWMMVKKYIFFSFNVFDVGKGILYIILIFGFLVLLSYIIPESRSFVFVSCAFFSVTLAFLLKLIDWKDIQTIFQKQINKT